jgi:NADH:ubiquinone oxidoreductase subunit C
VVISKILNKYVKLLLVKNSAKINFYIEPHNLLIFTLYLKQNSFFKLTTLIDITAIDHLGSQASKRFELVYSVWNQKLCARVFFKVFVKTLALSISTIFPSSSWFEREIWDMFGIKFLFNEDLRRILTDYGFKGHPMRKDFPLIGYIEIRYDDVSKGIITEQAEITQGLRFFKFDNPWLNWKF